MARGVAASKGEPSRSPSTSFAGATKFTALSVSPGFASGN